ncbi:MAG: response regulator [Calditrichaeota bacterium]|nr:response regulator [Calditrichota bacterium]MCB0270196.1 response regulator [Calditrichota bacterium]MCB0301222.1 response regulator [Calditrichota bacterium]
MSKVLIVEDEVAQRMLYEAEISEMGFQVVLAKDGVEAVEKLREHQPDAIILDLMMPNMHGLDAMRKLLSINPNIPVIIHTAYSHYKDNFMSWAAEEYVVKSSDLTELKSALRRVLTTGYVVR